ncbi:MAG TPA: hypothetical protein VH639_16585 [Bryobacteraceae bacterium]|jgi:hypothetical protein
MRVWWWPSLIAQLAFSSFGWAQAPTPQPAIQDLRVVPLSGNGGINDLERKIMTPLVVQVLDQESRPIEGAQVIFRFPLNGASATFPNQQNAQTTRTNADGQAAATGWMANNQTGTFQVQVTATRGNQMGQTTITMTNATRIVGGDQNKKKHWWSSKGAKIGIIAGAAGAVAAIVLATRGGNGSTTVTASPGAPTIGAPQ